MFQIYSIENIWNSYTVTTVCFWKCFIYILKTKIQDLQILKGLLPARQTRLVHMNWTEYSERVGVSDGQMIFQQYGLMAKQRYGEIRIELK